MAFQARQSAVPNCARRDRRLDIRVGSVLNRYLKERAGYELELVVTAGPPENVSALLDPKRQIDLATIESSSDEAVQAAGITGLATVGHQYFFVIAPASSAVAEVRDLSGRVNPGVRPEGQPPTLGERVLEYYGLLEAPVAGGTAPAVTIVRPGRGSIRMAFEAGEMAAATRLQFLHADLVDGLLADGRYRLVPIRDHDALSRALPGTAADFIPAGAFGPERRIPAEPVPTLSVATLLVARSDLPGRVASDILNVVYDPRFARDIQQELTEDTGREVGDLSLHPAAAFFYSRNELVTSERLGRVSFVVSAIAAVFTAMQFITRMRERDRRKSRRRLLERELERLGGLRWRLADADGGTGRELLQEADALLEAAERDAAADKLDAEGIQSVRSLHAACWRAWQTRTSSTVPPASA